jgi:hypothetical protein
MAIRDGSAPASRATVTSLDGLEQARLGQQ